MAKKIHKISGLKHSKAGVHASHGHRGVQKAAPNKEPEYMVQLSEPRMVRKDTLESLREVIIFMQGYETFRKIQEEKVVKFTLLKSDVKELHTLVTKLRNFLPKGKLHPVTRQELRRGFSQQNVEEEPEESETEVDSKSNEELRVVVPVVPIKEKSYDGLAELEAQLRSIENELNKIK